MQENIQNAIQQAMENAPERKFVESFEMAITLKDVDLKISFHYLIEHKEDYYKIK